MLKYATDRSNDLIRRALHEHTYSKQELENSIIDDAVAYFDRTGDHAALKEALTNRFAVGITKTTSLEDAGSDTETGYETYSKNAKEVQIEQGLIEAVTSGIGAKIATALANLFTAENQNWTFVKETKSGEKETAEDAEEIIKEHRKVGEFSTTMVNTDYLSCSINGAYAYVSWKGGHLQYHVVNPSCLYTIYHEAITDDGKLRAVDYGQIEDATAVVLRLSGSITAAPDKQQYLAIFGRSEQYPYGRHVTYRASRWDAIPDPNTEGVEYVIPEGFKGAGEIANPLSWQAAQDTSVMVPEYPIIAIDGGLAKTSGGLLNLTTSLFDNCIEIDMGYSRLLKDSLNAARGKDVVTNKLGAPLPRSLEGVISLLEGQELEVMGLPAAYAKDAMTVLESEVKSIGSGYSVPDYMLVSDPAGLAAASGVALYLRTKGLIDFRGYRIQANSPQVSRLFLIERGLITVYAPGQGKALEGVEQVWDPGTYTIPEDKAEKTARLDAAVKAGFIDHVLAVKEFHNLSTAAEAKALIEEMEGRKAEYPGPQPAAPKRGAMPVGITRQPPK